MIWTPNILNKVREYIALSMSAREIAEKLSKEYNEDIGRNSVIGVCRRKGIKLREQATAAKDYWAPLKKEKKAVVRKPKPLPKPVVSVGWEPKGIHLLELEGNHCRYPLWGDKERTDYRFCGNEAVVKGYCIHCTKKMFQ